MDSNALVESLTSSLLSIALWLMEKLTVSFVLIPALASNYKCGGHFFADQGIIEIPLPMLD
jgi:hypothetical protein